MYKNSHSPTYAIFTIPKVRHKLDFTQTGFERTCGQLHSVFQGNLPYLASAFLMLIDIDKTENTPDNNFRGTPRGSRKKPKVSRYPTGRLSTAVLCRSLEKNGMVRAWQV